jgi:hypothetical protein
MKLRGHLINPVTLAEDIDDQRGFHAPAPRRGTAAVTVAAILSCSFLAGMTTATSSPAVSGMGQRLAVPGTGLRSSAPDIARL